MNQLVSTVAPIASVLVLALFALPSYISLLRQRGFVRGLLILVLLCLTVLGLEGLMVQFKLPASYSYAGILGYKILGLVPWVIAFVYPPVFLAAFWLASKRSEGTRRILLTTLLSTISLLVLGAALTRMNLIDWVLGGPLYNVPPLSLIGWTIVSLVCSIILSSLWGDEDQPRRTLAFSGLGIMLFWSGVNLGLEQWIAGGLGVAIAIFLLVIIMIEKRRQNRERAAREATR